VFLCLSPGGSVGKVLRLARALRPLRLLKRNESMRLLVDALFGTIYPMTYLFAFMVMIMLVFGIIGMGLFGRKLKYCSTQDLWFYTTDLSVSYPGGKGECVGFFVSADGVMMQRAWVNPPLHFDTLLDALQSLFVVQTNIFTPQMQLAMDVTGVDSMLERNHSMYYALFFVCYVMVGTLFIMNLFLAFICDGFNANKGSDPTEIVYNTFMRQINSHKNKFRPAYFKVPKNDLSVVCRWLLENSYWQTFSISCIALNVLFNLSDHKNAPEAWSNVVVQQNNFINYILFFEVWIALLGYGPGGFFDDRWKAFDAIVAFGTLTGMILQNPSITKFAKAIRLLRVLRLMMAIRSVKVILETLVSVLPALGNIMLLLFLIYTIFAVLFIQTFGLTKNGWRTGKTADFSDLKWTLYTMYQIVTGDDWHVMMSDHSVQWPECTLAFNEENVIGWTAWKGEPLEFTDCGSPYSFIYWVVLKVVCESIMLNLFIGMILESFEFMVKEATQRDTVSWDNGFIPTNQLMLLVRCFSMLVQNTKGFMPVTNLHLFLMTLPQPIGFRKTNGQVQYGKVERATERLIRAELNVLIRARYSVYLLY
jgi:hypothetical protein